MISENEEVDSRTNGGCTSEVLVDLEQKGPGCFHKLDKNGTGIAESLCIYYDLHQSLKESISFN